MQTKVSPHFQSNKRQRVDEMGCGNTKVAAVKTVQVSSKGDFERADSAGELQNFEGASFDYSKVELVEAGTAGTLDFRVHFKYKGSTISPWHDIPLTAKNGVYNFLCEIPKWTRAKFEVSTKEANNPIKQDEKKGVLRDYKHGDMYFNYGCFPQTWEDPAITSEDTGFKGDDDPLDCLEIGVRQMKTGQVAPVKVLGVLAMIDDGETDWKVFCIRMDDPMAPLLNDVEDLEREIPGAVSCMREWLRVYKVAEGKPLNAFGLDEKCMGKAFAEKVIEETHGYWKSSLDKLRK